MDTSIKLDEVINFYLDAWELPDSQYRRIHALAVRGFRQIYMHASASPLSVELQVLGNKTANLPCDCLNALSVGVMNGAGGISPLTEDSGLGFGNDTHNNRTSEPTNRLLVDNESDVFFNYDGSPLTPFIFGQFGSGARSDLGFYRVDLEHRIVVFDFHFGYSSVWLDYLPVFTDNGDYVVNPFFVEAILGFIGWQDKRRSPSDRNQSKIEYYNELRIGKRSMKPFDAGQAFNQYYRTTRQSRF